MSISIESTKWNGWYRRNRREPWRVIVTAECSYAALTQLLDLKLPGDKTVLPAGENPNLKRRPPLTR